MLILYFFFRVCQPPFTRQSVKLFLQISPRSVNSLTHINFKNSHAQHFFRFLRFGFGFVWASFFFVLVGGVSFWVFHSRLRRRFDASSICLTLELLCSRHFCGGRESLASRPVPLCCCRTRTRTYARICSFACSFSWKSIRSCVVVVI